MFSVRALVEPNPSEPCMSTTRNGEENGRMSIQDHDYCKPKDLSVKPAVKKQRPIPPPLNIKSELHVDVSPRSAGLSSALNEFAILATGPISPLIQKNLPFRKRAHSVPDSREDPDISAPMTPTFMPSKSDSSLDGDSEWIPPLNLSLPPTPKAVKVEAMTYLKGLSGQLGRAMPALTASKEATFQRTASAAYLGPLSPRPVLPNVILDSGRMNLAPQHRYHSQPWNPFLPTPSGGSAHWLNGPPSALLSPAPSSLGSSQEDVRVAASYSVGVPSMPHSSLEAEGWRVPWPQPVWHSFQAGTLIKFRIGSSERTVRAEEAKHHRDLQSLSPDSLGPLMVIGIELVDRATAVNIKFVTATPGSSTEVSLVASCRLHDAFWVQEKGWCAVVPDSVYRQYGVRCKMLECLDRCTSPLNLSSPGICDKFKRFSFSPDVINQHQGPLSPPSTPTQKSQQPAQHLYPHPSSEPVRQQNTGKQKPSTPEQASGVQKPSKCPLDPDQPKRPMNAFMLFARQHRLKLIQMHPGKDNRFVSVILGEAWKQLPVDQKEAFVAEAKALSEERKRIYPECWKRKRTQSIAASVKTESPM